MCDAYAVSDGILALRRQLAEFDQTGVIMEPAAVLAIVERLKELGLRAQAIENQLQRLAWNERARRDRRHDPDAIVEAACAAGSNVVLFSPGERPFSDPSPGSGPWSGGSA